MLKGRHSSVDVNINVEHVSTYNWDKKEWNTHPELHWQPYPTLLRLCILVYYFNIVSKLKYLFMFITELMNFLNSIERFLRLDIWTFNIFMENKDNINLVRQMELYGFS